MVSRMKQLLLVDDEPGMTEFIKVVAQEAAFEVRTSNRPADFMESFKQLPPDAVIIDLAMPGIDGVELLCWLAQVHCQAPIVHFSGFDRRGLGEWCRRGEAR